MSNEIIEIRPKTQYTAAPRIVINNNENSDNVSSAVVVVGDSGGGGGGVVGVSKSKSSSPDAVRNETKSTSPGAASNSKEEGRSSVEIHFRYFCCIVLLRDMIVT